MRLFLWLLRVFAPDDRQTNTTVMAHWEFGDKSGDTQVVLSP
jgi:hypothetical protein